MRFKKGSAAAKAFMAKLRAAKGKPKKAAAKKKIGAVKKKAAPKKKAAVKRLSLHKDTKSHNVNIRVMSGTDIFGRNEKQVRDLIEKDLKYYIDFLERIKTGSYHTKNKTSKNWHLRKVKSSIKFLKISLKNQDKLIKEGLK